METVYRTVTRFSHGIHVSCDAGILEYNADCRGSDIVRLMMHCCRRRGCMASEGTCQVHLEVIDVA